MNIIDKLDKKISDKKNKKRLKEEEERLEYEKTQKLFKPISNFGTDVYKKNLADDFVKLENRLPYTYYHFILENNGDDDERFGVWANGMLSETPSKNQFNHHKYTIM